MISSCCSAKVINGVCQDCKEHCGEIDPTDLESMTKEELAEAKFRTEQALVDLEAQKTEINRFLVAKMKEEKLDGGQWGDYDVTYIHKKGAFDISVEDADRLYGAVETKTVVSTKKLNTLEKEGIHIPRKADIEYVQVKLSEV